MPSKDAVSVCMGFRNGTQSKSLSMWLGHFANCGENQSNLETNQFQNQELELDSPVLMKLFDLTLR